MVDTRNTAVNIEPVFSSLLANSAVKTTWASLVLPYHISRTRGYPFSQQRLSNSIFPNVLAIEETLIIRLGADFFIKSTKRKQNCDIVFIVELRYGSLMSFEQARRILNYSYQIE